MCLYIFIEVIGYVFYDLRGNSVLTKAGYYHRTRVQIQDNPVCTSPNANKLASISSPSIDI